MSTTPFSLAFDDQGRLVLVDARGRTHVGVEAVRAFPITSPHEAISIRDPDGHELLWIDRLDELAPDIRTTIEEELAKRHFLPLIDRIDSIEGRIEPTEWSVETDRGPTTFRLRNSEDVRRVAGTRVLIVDSHGIRYLIPDLNALDPRSRRLLARYI